jgi:serine phosphatase RsbU (regulator of sigma subunit)
MRLIVLQSEAMIADVVCGQEAIYVGSREGCRVHLPDTRLAAQQALIQPDAENAWWLQQLDTTCQVFVNGTTIVDRAQLKTGDEIQLLDYSIRVYPEYDETAAPRVALGTSRAQLERFAQSKLPMGAALKRADEPLAVAPGQLDGISRASLAAAGCTNVQELMDNALQHLLTVFLAQRAWIGVRRINYGPMEYEEGRLITGQATDLTELGHDLKPRALDRAQFILVPSISREDQTSVLAGPLLGPDGKLGMVYLDSGDSGRHFDARDLDYFIIQLNVIAYQLDAIFKIVARNRAALMDGQVSVAHEIQARLTPRKLPQWESQLVFGAFREPGRERTGNMYDVVRLSNNLAGFMIAHTPAAGALPSMLMVQAQTAFRAAVMHQDNPAACLRMLNWMLYDGEKDHPLECLVGVIDPDSGVMRYSLAGHLGACIIDQRGEPRQLGGDGPAPALGLVKSTVYPLLPEQLESGETLVLFTPGVITAKNRRDEVFGEERFVNLLCDGFGQLASAMLKEMLTDLRNFTEGGQQPDDITVILAHRV